MCSLEIRLDKKVQAPKARYVNKRIKNAQKGLDSHFDQSRRAIIV